MVFSFRRQIEKCREMHYWCVFKVADVFRALIWPVLHAGEIFRFTSPFGNADMTRFTAQ